MDAKLTLKLNQKIIERAKIYAAERKLSLSRVIENYLNSLTSESKSEIEVSSFVKSLSSKVEVPADFDYKKDYSSHLNDKHK